jgi:nucleotide-binding universal stress UspA family protein
MMTEENKDITINTILVAMDGSDLSDKALRYACILGAPLEAELIVLHIVPMLVSATPYHDTVSDQPFLALQKVGEDILSRAKQTAEEMNYKITDLISHGDPASRIIDIASERDVDLIVLGSRGIGGIKRLFVGSISDKVANHAPCPVMIVR